MEINIPKIKAFQTTNSRNYITVSFNDMHTLKFKAQLKNVFSTTVNQMFGSDTPASDYYQVGGNKIIEHSSDNETVLGSSRKLGGASKTFN